jgi:hypothetical protein
VCRDEDDVVDDDYDRTVSDEPGYVKGGLTAVDEASSPGVLLPALEFPEILLDEVNLGPTMSPLLLWY